MIRALLAATAIFCATLPACAVLPDEMLKDPALEARAREVSQELRCLVCQNQTIDDSNASLAKDLRVIVRERIVAGDSNQQVMDYMVQRYGNYVRLTPPFQADTIVPWLAPFALLLIGLVIAFNYLRQRPPIDEAEIKED